MKKRKNIETSRLILRPFELSDTQNIQKMAGDYAIADTTLNVPYPYKNGMAEEWISTHQSKFEAGEQIIYAITLKSNHNLIGAIGLTVNKRFNRAELGYWVGKKYWNNGYCTEASKAIIEFAFINFNYHKIEATHIKRNPASGKVMNKIGMTLEGTFKEHVIKWDKYEDVKSYGILKSEWEKIKNV